MMAPAPACLYFLYVGLSVFFYAKGHDFSGLPPESIPSLSSCMRRGWFYIGAPTILFSMIIIGYSPMLSAFCGTAFLVLAVAVTPRPRKGFVGFLFGSLVKSAKDNLMVGSVVGTIGIILGGHCAGRPGGTCAFPP